MSVEQQSRIVSWVMGKTFYRLPNFCDVLYRSRGTIHNVMNIKGEASQTRGKPGEGWGIVSRQCRVSCTQSTRRIYGGVRHNSLRTARVNSRVS